MARTVAPPRHLPGPVSPPFLVAVSHRASRCHPIPGELLRMEVIYWWPLCLFSLPLLLVLLSALLSYLATEGCLCVCMCVCECVYVSLVSHP